MHPDAALAAMRAAAMLRVSAPTGACDELWAADEPGGGAGAKERTAAAPAPTGVTRGIEAGGGIDELMAVATAPTGASDELWAAESGNDTDTDTDTCETALGVAKRASSGSAADETRLSERADRRTMFATRANRWSETSAEVG